MSGPGAGQAGSSFARPLILSGADVVLPDRVLSPGTVVIEDGRVTEIETGARSRGSEGPGRGGAAFVDLHGHTLVAGFVDVHVHGVEGFDVLESADAVEEVALRLPRYGVTAFCPTAVACSPADLARLIESMRRARGSVRPQARVLPAHLESNFINPEYRGAQPLECLRLPPRLGPDGLALGEPAGGLGGYSGADVLKVIEAHRRDVGIVTMAVELAGGLELARALVAAGHRVSLGHSGATYDEALAGIAAGARHATHLYNRMSPMTHRAPGLTGAVLASEEVAAEIICDGHHVHPVVAAMAIRSKGVRRTMAITDGTAGSGLPVGSKVGLGGRTITVTDAACFLDDGTLAGSRLTMDGAFRNLIRQGFSLVEASRLCSGTQAEELGLAGQGAIAPGGLADLVVLDASLEVTATYVGGAPAVFAVGATA